MEFEHDFADILILCGQGTYEDGLFHGEFDDRDVYLGHALAVPALVESFKYNLVVRSGGFSQAATPWLSEAQSFANIWESLPLPLEIDFPHVADEVALDSSENLLFGAMAARRWLNQQPRNIPIRRVAVFSAWKFKKWRLTRHAETLGILERFYFHGHASAEETSVQVEVPKPELEGFRAETVEANLLRDADHEAKRRQRWQNSSFENPSRRNELAKWERREAENDIVTYYYRELVSSYNHRTSALEKDFPEVFAELHAIAGGKPARETAIAAKFSSQVLLID